MGSKDFGKREVKKAKKDPKKGAPIISAAKIQPMPVEVVKKDRKPRKEE